MIPSECVTDKNYCENGDLHMWGESFPTHSPEFNYLKTCVRCGVTTYGDMPVAEGDEWL